MHPVVAFLLSTLALYAALGVAIGLAFVTARDHARTARQRQPWRAHPDPARRGRAVALRAHALAESGAMTRGHRKVHRLLWPVLAMLVAFGFTMALVKRPPPEPPASTELKTRANALYAGAHQMSVGFTAVQWNRRKIVYDAILVAGVVLFIGTFMTLGALRKPPADPPAWINLRIKAFGTCAFVMLTIILTIGPLARLSPRFLPLLYNRRHFGVLTFLRRARARVLGGRLVRRAGRDGRPDDRDDRQAPTTASSSASLSRHLGSSAFRSSSCLPQPGTISGLRSSPRASGRRCTWRSTSPTACW